MNFIETTSGRQIKEEITDHGAEERNDLWDEQFEARIQESTAAQGNAALQKHVDPVGV